MLHDRLYVEVVGQLPNRAQRQAAAAGLVAREARFVDEEDASPRSRKAVRGSRAGGPGTDDYRVEALHGPNPRRIGRQGGKVGPCGQPVAVRSGFHAPSPFSLLASWR